MILIRRLEDVAKISDKLHSKALHLLLEPLSKHGEDYNMKFIYIDSEEDYDTLSEQENLFTEDWEEISYFEKEKFYEIVISSEDEGYVIFIPLSLTSEEISNQINTFEEANTIERYIDIVERIT